MDTRFLNIIGSIFLLLSCGRQSVDRDDLRGQVQAFMEDYTEMLRIGANDQVADLYSKDGAVMGYHGVNTFIPFDSIAAHYDERPRDTIGFEWRDQRIDVLGDSTALVTANFTMHYRQPADTIEASYTGVLRNGKEGWKIIHETETPTIPTLRKWFQAGRF